MLTLRKFFLAGLLLFFLATCGGTPAPDPPKSEPAAVAVNGEDLFNKSCSVCHRIEKPISYEGDTPWKDIVDRMIQHEAKITPEEAAVIVEYLEKTYPR